MAIDTNEQGLILINSYPINHLSKAISTNTFIIKPIKPAPKAKNIQKVPARPAPDFLERSQIIKNRNAINTGNKTYKPQLVTVLAAIANINLSCW